MIPGVLSCLVLTVVEVLGCTSGNIPFFQLYDSTSCPVRVQLVLDSTLNAAAVTDTTNSDDVFWAPDLAVFDEILTFGDFPGLSLFHWYSRGASQIVFPPVVVDSELMRGYLLLFPNNLEEQQRADSSDAVFGAMIRPVLRSHSILIDSCTVWSLIGLHLESTQPYRLAKVVFNRESDLAKLPELMNLSSTQFKCTYGIPRLDQTYSYYQPALIPDITKLSCLSNADKLGRLQMERIRKWTERSLECCENVMPPRFREVGDTISVAFDLLLADLQSLVAVERHWYRLTRDVSYFKHKREGIWGF